MALSQSLYAYVILPALLQQISCRLLSVRILSSVTYSTSTNVFGLAGFAESLVKLLMHLSIFFTFLVFKLYVFLPSQL